MPETSALRADALLSKPVPPVLLVQCKISPAKGLASCSAGERKLTSGLLVRRAALRSLHRGGRAGLYIELGAGARTSRSRTASRAFNLNMGNLNLKKVYWGFGIA